MKFTPRPIALCWRKLWSASALDAMEPVLGITVNIRRRDLGSINLRRDRSYNHLRANLSAEDVEDVVPVVLLQSRERRRSPNVKPVQPWKITDLYEVLSRVEGSNTHHDKEQWGTAGFVLGQRERDSASIS